MPHKVHWFTVARYFLIQSAFRVRLPIDEPKKDCPVLMIHGLKDTV
jgi:hypothetical protein